VCCLNEIENTGNAEFDSKFLGPHRPLTRDHYRRLRRAGAITQSGARALALCES
jgi:hypothetical protein